MVTQFTPESVADAVSSPGSTVSDCSSPISAAAAGGGGGGGNNVKLSKVKKVNETKLAAMLATARQEMVNENRKRRALTIFDRCVGDEQIQLQYEVTIGKWDRLNSVKTHLSRNIEMVGMLAVYFLSDVVIGVFPAKLGMVGKVWVRGRVLSWLNDYWTCRTRHLCQGAD